MTALAAEFFTLDEVNRLKIAAKLLSLSIRQLQRVLVRYLADDAAGIASRKHGKPANNRDPDDSKLQVLTLLREKYSDFGPTLSHTKAQRLKVSGFRMLGVNSGF